MFLTASQKNQVANNKLQGLNSRYKVGRDNFEGGAFFFTLEYCLSRIFVNEEFANFTNYLFAQYLCALSNVNDRAHLKNNNKLSAVN